MLLVQRYAAASISERRSGMKIAFGCDPNAEMEKRVLMEFVKEKNYGEVEDFGSEDPIYAHTAVKVAEAVASGEYDRGVLLCGTGIGVTIAANKVKGAYAALASDVYSAQRARLSNDANILCMGAFTTGMKTREMMVSEFLKNEFEPGCTSQSKVDAFVEYDRERT
jgi:sugar-phosphate isomerases, RpiB/LacA/LacB family